MFNHAHECQPTAHTKPSKLAKVLEFYKDLLEYYNLLIKYIVACKIGFILFRPKKKVRPPLSNNDYCLSRGRRGNFDYFDCDNIYL
jgi:hypothetical protein